MSEPSTQPTKEGGLKQPETRPADPALSKTGGGEERSIHGESEGGMIGGGETRGASDSDD